MMIAKLPRVSALGIDTIMVMTDERIAAVKSDPRIEWIGQYIDNLTYDRVEAILKAGWMISPFTFAGEVDPVPRAAKLNALGFPPSVTVWLDIESESYAAPALISQINTWAVGMRNGGGFDPGEYAGAGQVLNCHELTQLGVDRYAHACSSVRDASGLVAEPNSGFCLLQLFPPNQRLRPDCDLIVDWDVVQADFHGRLPMMVTG